MPKECHHEYHSSEEMCHLEELISKISMCQVSHLNTFRFVPRRSPNDTVRSKGKPCLGNQCNDSGPVEYETRRKMFFHVMPSDMVYNKRESVQQGKYKEGIGDPSVENLKPFVRDPREKSDPVRLTRRCTRLYQYTLNILRSIKTYKTNGIQASAIHPDRVASAGELPYISLGQ